MTVVATAVLAAIALVAAGIALYVVLPDPWVAVAAGVAVVLNVVAETVSFSHVIERTPPLRWVDGLGRRA